MMTVGKCIEANRRIIRASKTWLASQVGVHRNTIANWESDKGEPNASQIALWAAAMGVGVADLVNGIIPDPVFLVGCSDENMDE